MPTSTREGNPATIKRLQLAIAGASLILLVVLALDLAPILRGTDEWAWEFKPVLELRRILPVVAASILYVVVGLWLLERRTAALLIWALLGGLGLPLAALNARGDLLFRLFSITASGLAEGWHMAATRIGDLDFTLRNWPEFMRASAAYSAHLDHAPPGIVLMYYALGHLLDRLPGFAAVMAEPIRWRLCQYLSGYTAGQYASAWLGMLMPVWSSLAIFPVYFLGRRVFGEQQGKLSALWWPLIPSFSIFSPLPNTYFPIPALFIVAAFWKASVERRVSLAIASGAMLAFVTFFTLTYAPLAVFLGLLALGASFMTPAQPPVGIRRQLRLLPVGVGLLIGFVVPWLIVQAATGLDAWGMWQTAQHSQVQFSSSRPYWPWLALSLSDFAMFTGWPLTLLAAAAFGVGIKHGVSRGHLEAGEVMTVAAGFTVVFIVLYGTPRGEVGRILLILAPWVLFAAANAVRQEKAGVRLFTSLQGFAAVVMIVCLLGVSSEFQDRAAPPTPLEAPADTTATSYASGAVFGQALRLVSAAGQVARGEAGGERDMPSLDLWLTWQAMEPMAIRYTYSVALSTAENAPASARRLVQPFGASYPTTCWNPANGDLTDRIRVPIEQPESGAIWVDLALVNRNTGQALPVTGIREPGETRVRLGPFR